MRRLFLIISCVLALCSACTTIECSLNNVVACKWAMTYAEGDTTLSRLALSCFATKAGAEGDTVLVNQAMNVKSLSVPMSAMLDADTLHFVLSHQGEVMAVDRVVVSKTNEPVFESVDCATRFHHVISGIDYTRNFIDSITISNKSVTNVEVLENLHIYLRSVQ